MDWAALSKTIEHLETLSEDEIAAEIRRLETADDQLSQAVGVYFDNREKMASFMQTCMPEEMASKKATLKEGAIIGNWKVLDFIGAGGMGEVYKAQRADGLFEQQVALKMALRKGKTFAGRFEAERQRLAQLDHPNIARIVDGGATDSNAPYMTMEYVDGQAIDDYAREQSLSQSARLQLIDKLCAAVSHAHGRLVLHRDIKHDNVLINQSGELRLIDFGVASLIGQESSGAELGALTLAYAAPEQLEGKTVSAATDIFAIGMLLHLLETDMLPERQSDGSVKVAAEKLPDNDLVAIIAKATAKLPAERYGSVDALLDDIRKFVDGFPVAARPVSRSARFRKLVKRNKLASAMSGLAAAAVITGIVGVGVFAYQTNEARAEAEFNLAQMEHYGQNLETRARMIQRAFGKSEDQEALASAFLEYAAEADELKSAEPERAATIKTVVGQFFMQRNDYPRAIAVLEPWIREGYGNNDNLQDGRGALARSYMSVGRMNEAVPLLRENEKNLRDSRAAFMPNHSASASQLAISSRDSEDLAMAKEVLLKTLDKAPNDLFHGYFFNQLGIITRLQGNFDEAFQYVEKSYEHGAKQPVTETTNHDTSAVNYAEILYTHLGDLEESKKIIEVARSLTQKKGESVNDGRILAIEAEMLAEQNKLGAAEDKLRQALVSFEQFAGPDTPLTLNARARLAEMIAYQGRIDEAKALAKELSAEKLVGHEATEMEARLEIMRAAISNAQNQGQPVKLAANKMDMVCTNIPMLRHYANLVGRGAVTPHDCTGRLKKV